jgi:hypothetical protein
MVAPNDGFSISEANLRRWRMIKIVSLLPLLVSIVLMFFFKGSMLGTILFFLILIVGVVLPQICENQVRSHLLLKSQIDEMEKKLPQKES